MQISRQLLLACAVATCLTPTWIRAYDNEAQIRARQALEDKMKQIEAQSSPTTSSPPAVVKKPASAKKPKPAPASPAATPAPPIVKSAPAYENPPAQPAPAYAPEISQPATPIATAPANDKLRNALHEKMGETAATPVAPAPAAPVVTMPAAPVAPAAAATPVYSPVPGTTPATPSESAPVYSSTPAIPTQSPDNQKLNEALNRKMQSQPTQPELAGPAMKPTPMQEAPVMGLPQLSGPPSSLTAAKQQKLNDLLQLYRADQLTPEQYHEQRAKILSGQ
ncbi:MAG TPA: hypothetical protein VH597_14265 [Verrucomicrobiae bacterium]|jgi:hypothetical protein|nr:hypothetical protein [Verrucomicrobiae bacterium]